MEYPKLKECPFCGSAPEMTPYKSNGLKIECKCGMGYKQRVLRYSLEWLKEKMAEKWNTRTSIN